MVTELKNCFWLVFAILMSQTVTGQTIKYEPISFTNGLVFRNQTRPTFIVAAAQTLRPDSRYLVSIFSLPESPDLYIKAAIVGPNRQQISGGSILVNSGSTDRLILKVPASISNGEYHLHVEGLDRLHPQSPAFIRQEKLLFNPQFLSIVIETNRAVYRQSMKVRFRVILMDMNLKPYTEPVTISMLDPKHYIMRRWTSRYPSNGVVSLSYSLPLLPVVGKWTIRVHALTQIHEQQVYVERYAPLLFDIIPSAPAYVLDTQSFYTVNLTCSFHSQRINKGNVTVKVSVKRGNETFKLVGQERRPWSWPFQQTVDLTEVRRASPRLADSVVRLDFAVHNFFVGEVRTAFIETKIIRAGVKLRFTGPRTPFFKPGMPFHGHIYVAYDDDVPLAREKLATAKLTLIPTVTGTNGAVRTLPEIVVPQSRTRGLFQTSKISDRMAYWMEKQAENAKFHQFRTEGVFSFGFVVPKDTTLLRIKAVYEDVYGDRSQSEQTAFPYYSSDERYIQIDSSTDEGLIGENAVFHLRSNFPFENYHFLIVSKGAIVYSDMKTLEHASRSTTFSFPVSNDMVPSFKVVAMIATSFGELLTDSITVPVQSLNRYKFNVTLSQTRDHSKKTVQLVTRTQSGSYVGISVLRWRQYRFQSGHTLSASSFLNSLYSSEPFKRSVVGLKWTDREGLTPDRTRYLVGRNPGVDDHRTLSMAGLHVITDAHIDRNVGIVQCDGLSSCLTLGCFTDVQKCDGNNDCVDGSDEEDCPETGTSQRRDFGIFRQNRYHDFYDWTKGDWAWYDIRITDDGEEFHDRPVPAVVESWFISGFSLHPQLGLSLLEPAIEYEGTRPVFFTAEAPETIRRGENLGIRLLGVNSLDREVTVIIILKKSNDYLFVETGPDGQVEHYKPHLVAGEKQHVVTFKPKSMLQVDFPIAPQVQQGDLVVSLETVSQFSREQHRVKLKILPEGATIKRYTSLLLDLKNRANVFRFVDIPVEETPIIPYSNYRRYVYGSPRASVSICGDVFGPVSPMPMTTDSVLGRSLRSIEMSLFAISATYWTLSYLRLTNQLKSRVMYQGFDHMNVHLANLMNFFNAEGSFRMRGKSKPSVWASAWALRVLSQSQFQDWENHFFVDNRLISDCVRWILTQQNTDGSFREINDYYFPQHRPSVFGNSSVTHTAHVFIALHKCSPFLQANDRVDAANAKFRAINFLEGVIHLLNDPYEIAIVTHALTLANSVAKETIFSKLHQIRRQIDGMIYWSRRPISPNNVTYENQRPFIQPHQPNHQDAIAVETTAYALLIYLARDGIGDIQERIVTWLNTMRMSPGGFVSIFDSMVAMEALTEYSYRARLRDITEMTVSIEASASRKAHKSVRIDGRDLNRLHRIKIPNVWGHVNVVGRGAGQAVFQLSVQFGIDRDDLRDVPMKPYFELKIDETYSHFGNKSHINVTACARWLALEDGPNSGPAILEIETPSGYRIVPSDAGAVVRNDKNNFLADVQVARTSVVWMISKVTDKQTCFSYELRRWFPVSNMTVHRSAIIYDSYSPDQFEMVVFNSTPLYALDICEVCGSYQCPYCPHFSSSPAILNLSSVVFLTCIFADFFLPHLWYFF